ncbi:MAG: FecR domain-containing protein [Sphingobium sp.]
MTDATVDAREAAIAWHVAMPSMNEAQWTAFTAWLEAEPAHAAAYDEVASADRALAGIGRRAQGEGRVGAGIAPPEYLRTRPSRRPLWIGAASAASLAALLLVGTAQWGRQDNRYTVVTQAGTSRSIAMGDGSTVVLNGGTRMAFDHDAPRMARLDEGEALFTVRHDADRPFSVTVGRFRVEDVGTVFNVVRNKERLSVSVAEGRVMFDPDGARLMLGAGDAVTVDEARNAVIRTRVAGVGGWRSGALEFVDAPLEDVAAAIHRSTGARIIVSAPLSQAPFTGNIRLSGRAGTDARHLATLVGANVYRDGGKWVLSSSAHISR